MLTDLDRAVEASGLPITLLPGWEDNASPGGEFYDGVSIHHTGSYDAIGDTSNDLAYAKWMCFEGRSDLGPPLCNLALAAEGRVYVGAAGNANGVGVARAVGPMPYTREGNGLYIVIEAMHSGYQTWQSEARLANGRKITYYEAYVRLVASLCLWYGWEASHVRAHYETSVTGKWDPGDPDGIHYLGHKVMDMDKFRRNVAAMMIILKEGEDVEFSDWSDKSKQALADTILKQKVTVKDSKGKKKAITIKQAIARGANGWLTTRDAKQDVLDAIEELDSDNA